jgi:hypothetical protein
MRSSQNALVHGTCTNEIREEVRKFHELLRYVRKLQDMARGLEQE